MKAVSLRTQNVLSFLPILNVSVFFLYIYNYCVERYSKRLYFAGLLGAMFIAAFFYLYLTWIQNLLAVHAGLYTLLFWAGLYFFLVLMGQALIYFQKKAGCK